MKSAKIVVALVLTLLVWVPVASEGFIMTGADYSIATPAPDGQASCIVFVGGTNPKGTRATLDVGLYASSGEAQIPELGIGDGFQEGCDIFPGAPSFTAFAVDISEEVTRFEWTLEVHAHPDADCEAGGTAEGFVWVVQYVGGQGVEVSLLCE